jgi:hypothetical protein
MLTCALCSYVNKADKSSNKQHINCMCICISRLLAHFSLPSFFSFVKRTHTLLEVHVACRTSRRILDQILFSLIFTYSHYLTINQPTTSSTYKSRVLIVIFRVHTVCVMPVYNRTTALKKKKRRKNDSTHIHSKKRQAHNSSLSLVCYCSHF